MKYRFILPILLLCAFSCVNEKKTSEVKASPEKSEYFVEQFADSKILRYKVPSFKELSLRQKQLVYYLSEAGMSGRDIMYDQNYRHNLKIRRALEAVYQNYEGDKTTDDWKNFEIYLKRIWFASGIHHHYGNDKFEPGFSQDYFKTMLSETGDSLSDDSMSAILDPNISPKKIYKIDKDKNV